MAWRISEAGSGTGPEAGRLDRLIVFTLASGTAQPVGELVFEGRGPVRRSYFRYAASWLADREGPAIAPAVSPNRIPCASPALCLFSSRCIAGLVRPRRIA